MTSCNRLFRASVYHRRCAAHRCGQLIFLYNLIHSRFWGKLAPNDNPWEATSLEWSTATPPPFDNFGVSTLWFITTHINTVSRVRSAIT